MESTQLVDCAGRRRSPATLPGYHRGRSPRNKGLRYPADPPTVEEIISVMRAAGDSPDGVRLRGVIVVLWRAGLRISEALALNESDLDSERGAVLVRHGKGDKRREVGMDRWAWEQLHPWLELACHPPGRVVCFACCGARPAGGGVRPPGSVSSSTPQPSAGVRPTGCAAPVATRSRRRDVPRGCPVAGHTAATRACRSRDHVGVPARDRQHRNRPRRSRAASADDLGHKRASARSLSRPATEAARWARLSLGLGRPPTSTPSPASGVAHPVGSEREQPRRKRACQGRMRASASSCRPW